MMALAVFGVTGLLLLGWYVFLERPSLARTRALRQAAWFTRRLEECNDNCGYGRRLFASGVTALDPSKFATDWAYSNAVHLHLLGPEHPPGAFMTTTTAVTTTVTVRMIRYTAEQGGLRHVVGKVHYDGYAHGVLLCSPVVTVEKVEEEPDTSRVTCLVCVTKDRF